MINEHGSLYAAVRANANAQGVAGRTTAYTADFGEERWLVRHYVRGGAIAPVMGDRYSRLSGPRSVRELLVSDEARARGIRTPLVHAAVEYRHLLFSRFDIAVEWIHGARDLQQALFAEHTAPLDAAERAASLIREVIVHGLIHPDLNLKNILVTDTSALVIDLDRCRLVQVGSVEHAGHMRARFFRSLEKWQRQTGKPITPTVRAVLEGAFSV